MLSITQPQTTSGARLQPSPSAADAIVSAATFILEKTPLTSGEREVQHWANRATTYMGELAREHGVTLAEADDRFSTLDMVFHHPEPMKEFLRRTNPPAVNVALGVDDLVLHGARYLAEEGCSLPYDIVLIGNIALGDSTRRSHLLLRLMSNDGQASFLADPTMRLHEVIGHSAAPCFEELCAIDWHAAFHCNDALRSATVARFHHGRGKFGPEVDCSAVRLNWLEQALQRARETSSHVTQEHGGPADTPEQAVLPAPSTLPRPSSPLSLPEPAGVPAPAIAAYEAQKEIGHIAFIALAREVRTEDALRNYTLRDGKLFSRIGLIMSHDANRGTIPMANYMQLLAALCRENIITANQAIMRIRHDMRTIRNNRGAMATDVAGELRTARNIPIDLPVAMGSHWNNAAAPFFARALADIVEASTGREMWAQGRIVQMLNKSAIDEGAIGPLRAPLNFYQRLQKTRLNATAMLASSILFDAGLIPKSYGKIFDAFRISERAAGRWTPAVEEPMKTLQQLSVPDARQLRIAMELDARAATRESILSAAVVPQQLTRKRRAEIDGPDSEITQLTAFLNIGGSGAHLHAYRRSPERLNVERCVAYQRWASHNAGQSEWETTSPQTSTSAHATSAWASYRSGSSHTDVDARLARLPDTPTSDPGSSRLARRSRESSRECT